MAELVLRNVRLLFNGRDMSGDMNSATLNYSNELVDATVFGSSGRKRKAGLLDCGITAAGWWNSAASSNNDVPEPVYYTSIGSSDDSVVSVLPLGTGLTNVAYMTRVQAAEFAQTGSVGAMYSFSFNAQGQGTHLVRGKLTAAGTLSSDNSTTAYATLTTVSSSQHLYVAAHVLSFSSSGASVTCEVQADNSTAFATPTTQASFVINESSDENKAHWCSTGAKAGSSGDSKFRVKFLGNTAACKFTGYLAMGIE